MDDGASKGGIVLLHGLNRLSGSMGRLAAAARREGYETCSPGYPGRHLALAALAAHVAPTIAAFESSFAGPLNIVTHSLGGLVARALILAKRPARLGRVVMLAPPNAGSEVADLLYRARLNRPFLGPVGVQLRTGRLAEDERLLGAIDFECGIIAGDRPADPVLPRLIFSRPNDGKVAVAATKVRGMADHIVLPVSHPIDDVRSTRHRTGNDVPEAWPLQDLNAAALEAIALRVCRNYGGTAMNANNLVRANLPATHSR